MKLRSKSSYKNLTVAMRIGVALNDKQGTQLPLRRCAPFFPLHGDSDTCLPCRCRVARRPVLKETRNDREQRRREIATGDVLDEDRTSARREEDKSPPATRRTGRCYRVRLDQCSPPPDHEELPNWSENKLADRLNNIHIYASNVNRRNWRFYSYTLLGKKNTIIQLDLLIQ